MLQYGQVVFYLQMYKAGLVFFLCSTSLGVWVDCHSLLYRLSLLAGL